MSIDSHRTPNTPLALEFKEVGPSVPVLVLSSDNLIVIEQLLQEKISLAPEFFRNSPLVLDLQEINKQGYDIDLAALIDIVRKAGLLPIGIRGGNVQQNKQALELLIPVYSIHSGGVSTETQKTKNNHSGSRSENRCRCRCYNNDTYDLPIRSGQRIYATGDLVILAQVSAGAEIMAEGNIHVYNTLRGRALAGVWGNTEARIFCFDLQAELISVAGNYKISEDLDETVRNKPVQIYLQDQALIIKVLCNTTNVEEENFVARIIVVTSGKGGVGTDKCRYCHGTCKKGHKTAVIDFDVGLRNLDLIMGCERRVVYDFVNVINGEATLRTQWAVLAMAVLLAIGIVSFVVFRDADNNEKQQVSSGTNGTSSTTGLTTTTSLTTAPVTTAPVTTAPVAFPTTVAPGSVPGQVTVLKAGPAGGSGEIGLAWDAVSGASGYRVSVADRFGGPVLSFCRREPDDGKGHDRAGGYQCLFGPADVLSANLGNCRSQHAIERVSLRRSDHHSRRPTALLPGDRLQPSRRWTTVRNRLRRTARVPDLLNPSPDVLARDCAEVREPDHPFWICLVTYPSDVSRPAIWDTPPSVFGASFLRLPRAPRAGVLCVSYAGLF